MLDALKLPHPVPTTCAALCSSIMTSLHRTAYGGDKSSRRLHQLPPSRSEMTRWLAEKAEALGEEIYPGFAASKVLYKRGAVAGIATNDFGIAKDGSRKETYARGMELKARATLFAEGCRGSLSQVDLHSLSGITDKSCDVLTLPGIAACVMCA